MRLKACGLCSACLLAHLTTLHLSCLQEPPKPAVLLTNASVLSCSDRPGVTVTSAKGMASPYGGPGGPYITAPLLVEGRTNITLTIPFEFTPWYPGQVLYPPATNVKVIWGPSTTDASRAIPGCTLTPVLGDMGGCTATTCNFTCAVDQVWKRETFYIRVLDGFGVEVPGLASMVTVSSSTECLIAKDSLGMHALHARTQQLHKQCLLSEAAAGLVLLAVLTTECFLFAPDM